MKRPALLQLLKQLHFIVSVIPFFLMFSVPSAFSVQFSDEELTYLNSKQALKVCIDPHWMPYESIDSEGQYVGMSSDYMEKIAQALGLPISLHPTPSWKDTLASARDRSCDLISMARETEERKAYLDFSTPYASYPYVIATTSDKPNQKNLNDHLDKTYAVVKGYAIISYLKDKHPNIKLLEVDNFDAGIKALREEKAFGYLDSAATIGYYISQKNLSDIKTSGFTGYSSAVSVASRNDEPILARVIQKALSSLTENKKQAIEHKWINVIYAPQQELKVGLAALTDEEKNFLNTQPTVTMCVDPDWMPYEAIVDGKHSGIGAEIIALIAERSGLTIQLVQSKTWSESLSLFKNKQCDVLSMLNQTAKRDAFMNYTRPYYSGHVVFVANNDHPFIADPSEVQEKRVVLTKGYSISEFIKRDFKDIEIIEVENYNTAFDMVASGEADLTADYLISSGERIQKRGLFGLKIAGNTPYKNDLRMGVQKDRPLLRSILDKYVATLNAHEVHSIVNKWRTVRYQKETNYTLIWQIIGIALFTFLITLYWNRRLAVANRDTQQALQALDESKKEIEKLAITDKLTGLYNRAKLDDALDQEIQRAERYNHPLSVFILDADHFKEVNDQYGHQIGDLVLKELAGVLTQSIRSTDIIGRWGGEEFLVICPVTKQEDAHSLAEKIRVAVSNHLIPKVGSRTVSIGVSSLQRQDTATDLLKRADNALYEAKSAGRNNVV